MTHTVDKRQHLRRRITIKSTVAATITITITITITVTATCCTARSHEQVTRRGSGVSSTGTRCRPILRAACTLVCVGGADGIERREWREMVGWGEVVLT